MFLFCPEFDILPIFFQESFVFAFLFAFRQKFVPKIPAKSAVFSANLSLQILRNFTFLPANYQKPCLIASTMVLDRAEVLKTN